MGYRVGKSGYFPKDHRNVISRAFDSDIPDINLPTLVPVKTRAFKFVREPHC